eukprot:m.371373 g.371373  ORF g.371373 m.371373 type:complete len:77 (-) comp58395_c0_seq1:104-334(-)
MVQGEWVQRSTEGYMLKRTPGNMPMQSFATSIACVCRKNAHVRSEPPILCDVCWVLCLYECFTTSTQHSPCKLKHT